LYFSVIIKKDEARETINTPFKNLKPKILATIKKIKEIKKINTILFIRTDMVDKYIPTKKPDAVSQRVWPTFKNRSRTKKANKQAKKTMWTKKDLKIKDSNG
jgi:hypothetical protein